MRFEPVPLVVALAALLAFASALSGCASRRPPRPDHVERLTVAVIVPNPCWRVSIRSVHRRGGELLVVSDLRPPPPDTFCTQVISEARDSVSVRTEPPKEVTHLVVGRTWDWGTPPSGTVFVESREELERRLEGAQRLGGFKDDDRPDS